MHHLYAINHYQICHITCYKPKSKENPWVKQIFIQSYFVLSFSFFLGMPVKPYKHSRAERVAINYWEMGICIINSFNGENTLNAFLHLIWIFNNSQLHHDRQALNFFCRISFLFICLPRHLLWGWKTAPKVLCYLYITWQFTFHFTCFFLELQLQAHEIAWAWRDKNQKIKHQNKQLPHLCLILKYLSLIIMQIKGDKSLPWKHFFFSLCANIGSSDRFY